MSASLNSFSTINVVGLFEHARLLLYIIFSTKIPNFVFLLDTNNGFCLFFGGIFWAVLWGDEWIGWLGTDGVKGFELWHLLMNCGTWKFGYWCCRFGKLWYPWVSGLRNNIFLAQYNVLCVSSMLNVKFPWILNNVIIFSFLLSILPRKWIWK